MGIAEWQKCGNKNERDNYVRGVYWTVQSTYRDVCMYVLKC